MTQQRESHSPTVETSGFYYAIKQMCSSNHFVWSCMVKIAYNMIRGTVKVLNTDINLLQRICKNFAAQHYPPNVQPGIITTILHLKANQAPCTDMAENAFVHFMLKTSSPIFTIYLNWPHEDSKYLHFLVTFCKSENIGNIIVALQYITVYIGAIFT